MLFRGLIQHVHSSAVYLVACNDGLTLLTAGFYACGGAHAVTNGKWTMAAIPDGRTTNTREGSRNPSEIPMAACPAP